MGSHHGTLGKGGQWHDPVFQLERSLRQHCGESGEELETKGWVWRLSWKARQEVVKAWTKEVVKGMKKEEGIFQSKFSSVLFANPLLKIYKPYLRLTKAKSLKGRIHLAQSDSEMKLRVTILAILKKYSCI